MNNLRTQLSRYRILRLLICVAIQLPRFFFRPYIPCTSTPVVKPPVFPLAAALSTEWRRGSCALINQIFVLMSSQARIPRMIHRTAAQFYCNNLFFDFYRSKRIIASVTVLHPPSFVASLCRHCCQQCYQSSSSYWTL
jgi:hypothetical protein